MPSMENSMSKPTSTYSFMIYCLLSCGRRFRYHYTVSNSTQKTICNTKLPSMHIDNTVSTNETPYQGHIRGLSSPPVMLILTNLQCTRGTWNAPKNMVNHNQLPPTKHMIRELPSPPQHHPKNTKSGSPKHKIFFDEISRTDPCFARVVMLVTNKKVNKSIGV